LNGFWSEKQQYSAAHQPDLRQILLVPVIKTFYILRKKEQSNQQPNCTDADQFWAEGCVGHYPI